MVLESNDRISNEDTAVNIWSMKASGGVVMHPYQQKLVYGECTQAHERNDGVLPKVSPLPRVKAGRRWSGEAARGWAE